MTAGASLSSTQAEALLAALAWQRDLGVTWAVEECAQDVRDVSPTPQQKQPLNQSASNLAPLSAPKLAAAEQILQSHAAAEIARTMAHKAKSLEELRNAIAVFELCELRKGARSLVFSDGQAEADIMIIGEAPGADEDRIGRPFVGKAGQLLDKMLAAIGLDRAASGPSESVYITNVLPWRPPSNRAPTTEEAQMMLPFLERHIALAAPKILVLMGNSACEALLGVKGITRLRGTWKEVLGRPALPMFHPAALLRDPMKKRESWEDLLALSAKRKEIAHDT